MMKSNYRGQIGLILLIIMGVVVSLVLSIASRSLSDTVLSRQEKESSVAFSLAETGVENALSALTQDPNVSGETILSDLKYNIENLSTYEMYVKELESAHLDMDGAVSLNIMWTKKTDAAENITSCNNESGGSPAAIEITDIQNDGTIIRSYYNAAGCSLNTVNGFLDGTSDGGTDYRSMSTYNVTANSDFLRIRPIYTGATISVSGIGLPKQQYVINSQAIGGDAQKEIEVRRGLDAPASVFDFAVFAGGTIVK